MDRTLFVLTLALSTANTACQQRPRADSGSTVAAEAPGCKEQVRAFGEWAKALDSEGEVSLPLSVNLARTELPARDVPVTLALPVTAQGVVLNGFDHRFEELHMLENQVREDFARAEQFARQSGRAPPPKEVSLYVERDVQWRNVEQTLRALREAGAKRVHFAMEGRTALAAPPEAYNTKWLQEVLGRPGDRNRAAVLKPDDSRRPPSPYAGCAAAEELMVQMSTSAVQDARRMWWERMPGAIEACDCKVDLAAAKNMLWAKYGRFSYPPLSVVSVELAPCPAQGEPTAPSIPAEAQWEAAWEKVAKAGQPLALACEPRSQAGLLGSPLNEAITGIQAGRSDRAQQSGGRVVPGGVPTSSGGLSREDVQAVFRRNNGQLRFCYELQLGKQPGIAGRVVVNLEIEPNGQPAAATVTESTLKSPELETCVAKRVRTWIFPKPSDGNNATASYPLEFKLAR